MGVYPPGGAHRSAVISSDEIYRYRLSRYWEFKKPALTFVMLNPSTADGEEDDPTIRRCVGFAYRMGYGGLMVCNLYALRATRPETLWHAVDPVGPENDRHLELAFRIAANATAPVVAAWGAHAKRQRVLEVLALPGALAVLHCLGVTKEGMPRHPLYLKSDSPLIPYAGPRDVDSTPLSQKGTT
jgi:hypothetical protein